MSHTITKHPVPISDVFTMVLPVHAEILKVECQRNQPMMWVLHTKNTNVIEVRHFRIYGTGHDIDHVDNLIHIGTFQMHNGDLIWHMFEEIEDSTLFIEDVLKESQQFPQSTTEQSHAQMG